MLSIFESHSDFNQNPYYNRTIHCILHWCKHNAANCDMFFSSSVNYFSNDIKYNRFKAIVFDLLHGKYSFNKTKFNVLNLFFHSVSLAPSLPLAFALNLFKWLCIIHCRLLIFSWNEMILSCWACPMVHTLCYVVGILILFPYIYISFICSTFSIYCTSWIFLFAFTALLWMCNLDFCSFSSSLRVLFSIPFRVKCTFIQTYLYFYHDSPNWYK